MKWRKMAWFGAIFVCLVALAAACRIIITIDTEDVRTPTPAVDPTTVVYPTSTPAPWRVLWDPRLDTVGVVIHPRDGDLRLMAAWVTVNGNWDDVPTWAKLWQRDTLGGDHHVFGRVEDLGGAPVWGKRFFLAWPDGGDERRAEPDGWANMPIYGTAWDPQRSKGPYTWYVEGGDQLVGLGLPYNQHWSYFAVWVAK